MTNFYEALGLNMKATPSEIVIAYEDIKRVYSNTDDLNQKTFLDDATLAFQTLSN